MTSFNEISEFHNCHVRFRIFTSDFFLLEYPVKLSAESRCTVTLRLCLVSMDWVEFAAGIFYHKVKLPRLSKIWQSRIMKKNMESAHSRAWTYADRTREQTETQVKHRYERV